MVRKFIQSSYVKLENTQNSWEKSSKSEHMHMFLPVFKIMFVCVYICIEIWYHEYCQFHLLLGSSFYNNSIKMMLLKHFLPLAVFD